MGDGVMDLRKQSSAYVGMQQFFIDDASLRMAEWAQNCVKPGGTAG